MGDFYFKRIYEKGILTPSAIKIVLLKKVYKNNSQRIKCLQAVSEDDTIFLLVGIIFGCIISFQHWAVFVLIPIYIAFFNKFMAFRVFFYGL
ncbi:hypothetical protein IMSAGC019_00786 [Lachnospiraceae bacterium]|nr:hypothetical protein IMSAGC019_00786 [Lachnospiraceae bacterium]